MYIWINASGMNALDIAAAVIAADSAGYNVNGSDVVGMSVLESGVIEYVYDNGYELYVGTDGEVTTR